MRSLLCAFCFVSLTGVAYADVVMPPPKNCPVANVPMSSHCGPECRMMVCKTDKDCKLFSGAYGKGKKKYVCRKIKACVSTFKRASCSGWSAGAKKKYTYYRAHGLCQKSPKCAKGSCQERKICVAPVDLVKPRPRKRPAPRRQSPPAKRKESSVSPASEPQKRPKAGKESSCSTFSIRGTGGTLYLFLGLWLFVWIARRRRVVG